jgi:hypothetical protein
MATPGSTSYKLFVPKQAAGANLVYFDLFVATTANASVVVKSVLPVVSGAVTVTGVLGVDLHLQYTTAIGTGGTAATYNGTDIAAATITPMSFASSKPPPDVTARLTPSGGATASGLIAYGSVFTEEAGNAYQGHLNELVARTPASEPITLIGGTGIRVVQGAVASVGNIGFEVLFEVIPK